jgi:hypothetical protein
MRKILLTTATLVATASAFAAFGSSPSQAASNDWCAFTTATMTSNCAYSTLAQCSATVSGQGGTCERNGVGVRNAQARAAAPVWRAAALPNYWEHESYRLGH